MFRRRSSQKSFWWTGTNTPDFERTAARKWHLCNRPTIERRCEVNIEYLFEAPPSLSSWLYPSSPHRHIHDMHPYLSYYPREEESSRKWPWERGWSFLYLKGEDWIFLAVTKKVSLSACLEVSCCFFIVFVCLCICVCFYSIINIIIISIITINIVIFLYLSFHSPFTWI